MAIEKAKSNDVHFFGPEDSAINWENTGRHR